MRTIKATTLDYLLLGLLGAGPRSGYDLRVQISQTPLRQYSDSPGAIYPALRRLVERGWVKADRPSGGRRRQVLHLTARGRKAFAEWLGRPIQPKDVVSRGEELLLRFAFMGPATGLAERFLEQFEEEAAAYLETLQQHHTEQAAVLPLTARLAFEYGLAQHEARLRWIRKALQAVRKQE
jgi:DNA-binding PadR family transcriptional regulator